MTSLYTNLFKRNPDSAGLANSLNTLLAAYQPQRQAEAMAVQTTLEFRRDLLASLYRTYLRRSPTPNELTRFAARLGGSLSDESIIVMLLASDEYFQNPNLGGSSNSIWLNQVYRDLFGRDRDPASDAFLSGLNNGTMTRAQVVATLVSSQEYRSRVVNQDYVAYLGRSASDNEKAAWANQLSSGLKDEQLVAILLSSSEYFVRQHQFP